MPTLASLFKTSDDLTLTVVRLTMGLIMFPHGAQKLLGWFGGMGFEWTMGWFSRTGIPVPLALLSIGFEFFGPLALIVGAFSRVAALGIAINMLVATVLIHWRMGFFMNWWGRPQGEGFEFHLLFIGMGLAIMMGGAGAYSVDRLLARWLSNQRHALGGAVIAAGESRG